MTINELIVKIDSGKISIEQAVDVIEAEKMTYGITYFSPNASQLTYWPMLREWRRRQDIKQEQAKKPVVVQPAPELRTCSCGHTVPLALVMSASMGSSCPDCYDRMSN